MPPTSKPIAKRGRPAFKPPRPAAKATKTKTTAPRRKSAPAKPSLIDSTAEDDEDGKDDDDDDPELVSSHSLDSTTSEESETLPTTTSMGTEDAPPTIPPALLTRLLHHHFHDDKVRIGKEANGLVGKYMETFVREAIARAAFERSEAGGKGIGGDFLEHKMDTKLVIHCVGLEGLTITVSGADHSIPLTTEVLRVITLLGSVEYTVPQLPITYDTTKLNGNLTISDTSGKALYRWRSHAAAQPPPTEPRQSGSQPTSNHEWERHSPSISAPPSYRTAETTLTSRCSTALNGLDSYQDVSSDAEAMAEDSNEPHRLRSRDVSKVNYLESSLSRSSTSITEDHSTSSSPVRRPKRKPQRKSKGNFYISKDSDTEPSGPDTLLVRKRRSSLRTKVATKSDSGSDRLESDIAPPRKQRSKRRERTRLEDSSEREPETPVSDITSTRKIFLLHLIDRLLRENDEDSEPFAKPVDAVEEEIPTYHKVIKRAMDLRTLKENLGKGVYSAVEDFEADFNLIIENSIRFNGLTHEVSQSGLRLLNVFNALMALLPGRN
ncbi:MAG: hypothetical protein ASARMPRED_000568 [Alectoria sarmentosa]|nr:MAG: hypothetical protein ASARMPRED_000568 [Alectoria sarmentosa]